jgi:hypothetical protein
MLFGGRRRSEEREKLSWDFGEERCYERISIPAERKPFNPGSARVH